jgi:hypothetical protein
MRGQEDDLFLRRLRCQTESRPRRPQLILQKFPGNPSRQLLIQTCTNIPQPVRFDLPVDDEVDVGFA